MGSMERAWSRAAFGHEQFSRGVDSNDKDLLWLLARTELINSGTERCENHLSRAEPLVQVGREWLW